MTVRHLALVAVAVLLPVSAGCGSSGGGSGAGLGSSGDGKPSTAELAAKIQEEDSSLTDEQATCTAEILRDELPADVLRQIMDGDDGDTLDLEEQFLEELGFERGMRLVQGVFSCMGFGEGMDLSDLEGFDPDGDRSPSDN